MKVKEVKEKEVKPKKKDDSKKFIKMIFIGNVLILVVLIINTIFLAVNMFSSNSFNAPGNIDNSHNEELGEYDVSKLKEVSASELIKKTKGANTVVYIGRSSCSWCVKFMPVVNDAIAKYSLKPLYIDIAKIIDYSGGGVSDQASFDIIYNLDAASGLENYMQENFGATPMVLIIKDGKIIDAHTGYSEAESFNSFLEKNGFKAKK